MIVSLERYKVLMAFLCYIILHSLLGGLLVQIWYSPLVLLATLVGVRSVDSKFQTGQKNNKKLF